MNSINNMEKELTSREILSVSHKIILFEFKFKFD